MMRIRKKSALIICGVVLTIFFVLYIILNHSMPVERAVSFDFNLDVVDAHKLISISHHIIISLIILFQTEQSLIH